jgi:hypothetical protein
MKDLGQLLLINQRGVLYMSPQDGISGTRMLASTGKEYAAFNRTNEILRLASAFFAKEADPTRRRWWRSWKRIITPSSWYLRALTSNRSLDW